MAFLIHRNLFLLTIPASPFALRLAQDDAFLSTFQQGQLTSELLKVLYNLLSKVPDVATSRLHGLFPALYSMFDADTVAHELSDTQTSAPIVHVVHALLLYTPSAYGQQWFADMARTQGIVTKLFRGVDALLTDHEAKGRPAYECEERLSPIAMLLANLVAANEDVKQHAYTIVFPDTIDRSQPLDKGSNLTSRLIRLMTSALLPKSKELVSELLFALCDHNVDKLNEHVGLGNAAGFLINRGLFQVPQTTAQHGDRFVDPITGQLKDTNQPDPFAGMTDEEKEREAERLFVLFDRLQKTGVVKVMTQHNTDG
jgi:hypothetical protein